MRWLKCVCVCVCDCVCVYVCVIQCSVGSVNVHMVLKLLVDISIF